jgi:hemolysin III
VTHGLGLVLCIGGVAVLLVLAALYGTAWHIVSFSIYGASLILVYTSSTVYHSFSHLGGRRALQILDHVSIFLLIAGTYTPFTLTLLRGGWGWSLFGVVWSVSVVGIGLKLFYVDRYEILSTVIYLGLGWVALVAIVPLWRHLPLGGFLLLVLGGVAYSLGTPLYHWERIPFSHSMWHLFVLAGSACHYFAILFYLLDLP